VTASLGKYFPQDEIKHVKTDITTDIMMIALYCSFPISDVPDNQISQSTINNWNGLSDIS